MKAIYYIILLLLLVQCKKPSCFESSGKITSSKRVVGRFNNIHLYDNINLAITQGDEEAVFVEANEKMQPNISVKVENNKLIIRNNSKCGLLSNPNEKITVFATVEQLDSLFYDGSGNISSTNTLYTPDIKIFSDKGAGNIYLSVNTNGGVVYTQLYGANVDITIRGTTSYLGAYVNSRSSLDFSELNAIHSDITYLSSRDSKVNVSHDLRVKIHHTGNIFYLSNPIISKAEYHSTGRLIKTL